MSKRNWLLGLGLAMAAQGSWALDLDGELAWAQRMELGTLVSGVVTDVPVRVGQQVAKGAVLVRLDQRSFRTDLSSAQAALHRADAQLDEARREDERAQELYDRTLLSDHERQLAQIARVDAESVAAQSRAALGRAKLALERSTLIAPMEARVVALNVSVGQAVVSQLQSQPLVVIAAADRMLAQASIAASQLGELSVGQAAEVGLSGQWLKASVAEIGLEPVARNGREALYLVRLSFLPPAGPPLRAGLPVVLRLDAR